MEKTHVSGSRAAESGAGVDEHLGHLLAESDGRKEALGGGGVGRPRRRPAREDGGAAAHQHRRVGHHADHARLPRQHLLRPTSPITQKRKTKKTNQTSAAADPQRPRTLSAVFFSFSFPGYLPTDQL